MDKTLGIETVARQEKPTFASLLKRNTEEMKKAKPSAPTKETVSQVVRETAELAIQSGLQKIDTDSPERSRRVCNVVIKRVEEHGSGSNDGEVRKKYDRNFVMEKLQIPAAEIISVFRAGPLMKKLTNDRGETVEVRQTRRPLIVKLVDRASAEHWHRNGKGLEKGGYYINQDLCYADRHAGFLAREEYRKKKESEETS